MRSVQVKVLVPLLLVVLVFSAIAASSAQAATEGPFYKVSGARLASGSTKAMTLKRKENMTMSWSGVVFTCTGVSGLSGTKIAGSSGANSATSEATLAFTGCTVNGAGNGCVVENEKITTSLLKGTLGYATSTRTGKLEMLLKAASGSTFMNVHFHEQTGGECRFPSGLTVEGKAVVYVHNGSSVAEVGVNEVQAKTNEIEFKPNYGTKIWTESAGVLSEAQSNLTSAGSSFGITAKILQELEGTPEWGTFTS
jgi:hypothetical protein